MFTRYKGEILTLLGAIFFSFNGVIAKLVLTSGLSSMRLTQVRCGGAFVFLGIFATAISAWRSSSHEVMMSPTAMRQRDVFKPTW